MVDERRAKRKQDEWNWWVFCTTSWMQDEDREQTRGMEEGKNGTERTTTKKRRGRATKAKGNSKEEFST